MTFRVSQYPPSSYVHRMCNAGAETESARSGTNTSILSPAPVLHLRERRGRPDFAPPGWKLCTGVSIQEARCIKRDNRELLNSAKQSRMRKEVGNSDGTRALPNCLNPCSSPSARVCLRTIWFMNTSNRRCHPSISCPLSAPFSDRFCGHPSRS